MATLKEIETDKDWHYKLESFVNPDALLPEIIENNGVFLSNSQGQFDEPHGPCDDSINKRWSFKTPREGRNLKGRGDDSNSESENIKCIQDYLSKVVQRKGVSIDNPPLSHPTEEAKVPERPIRLLNSPANLNVSRERRNLEGNDAGNRSIYNLIRENEELRRNQCCIVCRTNQRCVVFIPCGHLVICLYCKNHVKQTCPICRGKISEKIKVLFK